jgi:hypothetical protein
LLLCAPSEYTNRPNEGAAGDRAGPALLARWPTEVESPPASGWYVSR